MQIVGEVLAIIYYSEKTGYTVLSLLTEDGEIKAVGTTAGLVEGTVLELEGDLVVHKTYGEQFRFTSYQRKIPQTEEQLIRYLSSGIISGVGEVTAKDMVKVFGMDTLAVILKTPEKLVSIKGISEKRAKKIHEAILEQEETREIVMYLLNLGFGMKRAHRIYSEYGMETISVIEKNPYQLIRDIDGIGFRTADGIALKNQLDPHSIFRMKAGLFYLLTEEAYQKGNCYVPEEDLIREAMSLLEVGREELEQAIFVLHLEGEIYREQETKNIYLNSIYEMEKSVAQKIVELLNTKAEVLEPDLTTYRGDFEFSEEQKLAIRTICENNLVIVTGGPGTGKTTIIREVLRIFREKGLKVELAAPTGRAAKRMQESTGAEAKTLHRLMGIRLFDKSAMDEDHLIEADALVLDEMSMIDINLMYQTLNAIEPKTRVVLIGDVDQLPSVGPGNVLRDLIDSGRIPTIFLETIYRQGEGSGIVRNAHAVNRGEMPQLDNRPDDFYFMQTSSPKEAAVLIRDLVVRRLPAHYGFDPVEDIQILSPMKRGICGVEALNASLQEALNPKGGKAEVESFDRVFREEDKVMQIKNNYEVPLYGSDRIGEVFNGDSGRIRKIDPEEETVLIDFDGQLYSYSESMLDELMHSYAITVHKSQGSEFPCVIIPVVEVPRLLRTRNILYTAITRAKKLVVLVGRPEMISSMIRNNDVGRRRSTLALRIREQEKTWFGFLEDAVEIPDDLPGR